MHILNVRQTAFARNIEIVNNNALGLLPSHGAKLDSDGIVLRPGSRAKVRFGEFMFCIVRLSCFCGRAVTHLMHHTFFIALQLIPNFQYILI